MHYLLFGSALWAFTLFGLALHTADVTRRAGLGTMELRQYHSTRPIEWLLSGLLLFAAGAAVMGGIQAQGLHAGGGDAVARYEVLVGAALTAVALTYLGVRCATSVKWARDDFLGTTGATVPDRGEVLVNVAREAMRDARIVRRSAFALYAIGATPLVLAALHARSATVAAIPIAIFAAVLGAGIVQVLLTYLPTDEEKDEW